MEFQELKNFKYAIKNTGTGEILGHLCFEQHLWQCLGLYVAELFFPSHLSSTLALIHHTLAKSFSSSRFNTVVNWCRITEII